MRFSILLAILFALVLVAPAFSKPIFGIQGTICKKARNKPIPGGWAYIRGNVPDVIKQDLNKQIKAWKAKVMIPKGEKCKTVNAKVAKACVQVTSQTNYEYRAMVRFDCGDHIHDKPFQARFSI